MEQDADAAVIITLRTVLSVCLSAPGVYTKKFGFDDAEGRF